jgi:hypothetical protein
MDMREDFVTVLYVLGLDMGWINLVGLNQMRFISMKLIAGTHHMYLKRATELE